MWIAIVPLVIALASALVGVFGKSWDDDKKGWRRLTLKGWLVIAFSVVSFSVAAIQASDAYKLAQEAKKREQVLGALAREDVYNALNALLRPFKLVLDERGGGSFDDPLSQHMYSPMERIEILGSVQFMELLDHVAALGCPKNMNPSGCSWARGFAAAAARGDDAIREAASRYTNALPPETLALMQGVRAHKMIGILKSMPGNIEINRQMKNAEIENVSVGYLIKGPYDFSENYLPFLALIRKLENVLPPAILDATHNGL